MTDRMKRLNELARKARGPKGLSAEEQAEREALRQAYLADFRRSMSDQLEGIRIREPDGTLRPLRRRDEPGEK